MTRFRTPCLAAALAISAAVLPAIATAAPADYAVTVSTSHLDLRTAQGVAALRHRLRDASKTVCEHEYVPDVSDDQVRQCRIDAMHAASGQMRSAIRVAQNRGVGAVQVSANTH